MSLAFLWCCWDDVLLVLWSEGSTLGKARGFVDEAFHRQLMRGGNVLLVGVRQGQTFGLIEDAFETTVARDSAWFRATSLMNGRLNERRLDKQDIITCGSAGAEDVSVGIK